LATFLSYVAIQLAFLGSRPVHDTPNHSLLSAACGLLPVL
jgi:hypothetical protein